MFNIQSKVALRIQNGIKKFQPVLTIAKSRDVGESDTVIIITDIINEILGFDKYSEITSEFMVKSTYCDLATRIGDKVQYLIEAKAIGLELKEQHVKQAVDYASNFGVDWVVLTNGIIWKIFKISFAKPVEQELVYEFDFLQLNPRAIDSIEPLYIISKEGFQKSAIEDFDSQRQILSKYFISAILTGDNFIDSIRRELKKLSPDIKIEGAQIKSVLYQDVLKRDVLEGEKLDEAKKKLQKIYAKISKEKIKAINRTKETGTGQVVTAVTNDD